MTELDAAYTATSYVVDVPGSPIALRVGEPSDDIDALLATFGATTWALVTAYNPRSERRSDEENRQRHRELQDVVRSRGLHSLPSAGVGDDGTWPTERGLLIIDISRSDASELGRDFEQNAILFGTRACAAELVYCVERP